MKGKKTYSRFIPCMRRHISIFTGLSCMLFMIITSCGNKESTVLYKDSQQYEIVNDSNTIRIICHKYVEECLEKDTTEAYYDKGEYRLADGSLFMSTKRDTSYTIICKDKQNHKKNVTIRPEKYEDNNNRFITLINYFYIYPAGEKETQDSISAINKHYAGALCTIIQNSITYNYDKDYHIYEIQEMASFFPK